MTEAATIDREPFYSTDGEIAVINLNSARLRSWSRFFQNPLQPGTAEIVIEQEQFTAQFVGDVSALDRLESLAKHLVQLDPASARTALIQAKIASMAHRFSDARHYLAQADLGGAASVDVTHLRLNLDQACGLNLDAVMDTRRKVATKSERLEVLVSLGSLLADLREFAEADHVYRRALLGYQDVSPFAIAWVYFQLGVLWGELVPEPDLALAERWYRKAITCLPGYVKARVHLAEVYSSYGWLNEAEALLVPALASGDPEANWRLSDVLAADGKRFEADAQLDAARSRFEALLERHLLAFADHGAEFYSGSGNDALRALKLARINLSNRPTLRAFEQAHATALAAGESRAATELLADAHTRWGSTAAFQCSSLAMGTTAVAGREDRAAGSLMNMTQ